jgi:hypothetical protein
VAVTRRSAMARRSLAEIGQRASRRLRLFGVLLLALLVVETLPLPWRLSGLGFGVLAIGTGIGLLSDLAALRRGGQPANGWIGVSVGLGLATLMTLMLGSEALFYPLVSEQEDCIAGALTHTAQQQCQQTLEQRMTELGRQLQGSG